MLDPPEQQVLREPPVHQEVRDYRELVGMRDHQEPPDQVEQQVRAEQRAVQEVKGCPE